MKTFVYVVMAFVFWTAILVYMGVQIVNCRKDYLRLEGRIEILEQRVSSHTTMIDTNKKFIYTHMLVTKELMYHIRPKGKK